MYILRQNPETVTNHNKVFEKRDLVWVESVQGRNGIDHSKVWKCQLYCQDRWTEPSSSGPDKEMEILKF